MTVVAERPWGIDIIPDHDAGTVLPRAVRVPPMVAIRRTAVAAILAGTVTVAVAAVFDGPFARVWYEARQRHLVSDLSTHREGIRPGQAVGILQIPKLGVNVAVVQGAGSAQLRAGPAHAPATPLPGSLGNSVVFGRRMRWGGPFAHLGRLAKGDLIAMQVRNRRPIVFTVVGTRRVAASIVQQLAPSDDHRLTLVTGTGGRRSTERLVVSAVSDEPGRLKSGPAPKLGPKVESPISNAAVAWLAALVVVALASIALTRSMRRAARALVAAPVAATFAAIAFLQLDLLLPPLR